MHEIEGYCKIAEPTHGLITNCGKAHLEGFGSIEGVRKGKGELFDYLKTRADATAFIMKDLKYLDEMSVGVENKISYGTADADIIGNIETKGTLLTVNVTVGDESSTINTQLVGGYNLPNVLAAVAAGSQFGVALNKIKSAVESYRPSNSRSQLLDKGSNKIILDAYNANPSSMKLAIENFEQVTADKKILMLGAMAEMGADTDAEHKALTNQIKKYNWHKVVLVGKPFLPYKDNFIYFDDSETAAEWTKKQYFEKCYFLIKGSRSSKMENIVSAII